MHTYSKGELVQLSNNIALEDGLALHKGTVGIILTLPNPKGIRRNVYTVLFEDHSCFGGMIEVPHIHRYDIEQAH